MKIRHKIMLGYAIALSIAISGATIGLLLSYRQASQEFEKRESAIHLYRFLIILEVDILYNRPAKQLVTALQKPLIFDQESQAFLQRLQAIKSSIRAEINGDDWSGSAALKADLVQYIITLNRIHQKTSDVIAQIDPLTTSARDLDQANALLLGLVGSPEFKAFIEFPDRLAPYQKMAAAAEKDAIANLMQTTRRQTQITITWLVLSLAIAMVLALVISRMIAAPLQAVTAVAQRATQESDLTLQAPVQTQDEVGTLATAFNQLITQVRQLLADQAIALQREQDHTQELALALTNLKATQQELIQSAKMVALGQLTASISHEINTPLGVIRNATASLETALQEAIPQLPALLQSLTLEQQHNFTQLIQASLQQPLSYSTKVERQRRRQLQAQLVAQGTAQAEAIAYYLTLLRIEADPQTYQTLFDHPHCLDLLQVAYNLILPAQKVRNIYEEVNRAARIVFALNLYSDSNQSGLSSRVNLCESLENALTLYQSRLSQGIQVVRQYNFKEASLLCNPDGLAQIWVNLIDNAIDAMGQQGILDIIVTRLDRWVVVNITDSGCGIPSEIRTRIFEPFFTTKLRGEGSGLGLDITHQLVERLQGRIWVASQPGRTTFTVRFPITD